MAEACQTMCGAYESCTSMGEQAGIKDYANIAREAVQSCMAPVVGEASECYVVVESAHLIGYKPELDKPDYPDVRRYA